MSIFDIKQFVKTARKEWMIENNLHWHLDYTLKKDSSTFSILKNVELKKKYSKKLPLLMITLIHV